MKRIPFLIALVLLLSASASAQTFRYSGWSSAPFAFDGPQMGYYRDGADSLGFRMDGYSMRAYGTTGGNAVSFGAERSLQAPYSAGNPRSTWGTGDWVVTDVQAAGNDWHFRTARSALGTYGGDAHVGRGYPSYFTTSMPPPRTYPQAYSWSHKAYEYPMTHRDWHVRTPTATVARTWY